MGVYVAVCVRCRMRKRRVALQMIEAWWIEAVEAVEAHARYISVASAT